MCCWVYGGVVGVAPHQAWGGFTLGSLRVPAGPEEAEAKVEEACEAPRFSLS